MLICGSPRLIAAYRVLHRQSVPWHPPCALVRLIFAVLLRPPKTVEAEQDTVVVLLLSFPCAVFKMRLKISDSLWNLESSKRYSEKLESFISFFLERQPKLSFARLRFRFGFSSSFRMFAGLSGSFTVFLADSCVRPRIREALQLLSSP